MSASNDNEAELFVQGDDVLIWAQGRMTVIEGAARYGAPDYYGPLEPDLGAVVGVDPV